MPGSEYSRAVQSFGAMAQSAKVTAQELESLKEVFAKVQLFQADLDRITYFAEHPYVIEENEL